MTDCDCLFNLDIADMLDFHIRMKADVTVNTCEKLHTDKEGRVIDIDLSPSAAFDVNVNAWVFNRDYIVGMVKNAVSRGYSDFVGNIISKMVVSDRLFEYKSNINLLRIKNLSDYFKMSMKLLSDSDFRNMIFDGVKSRKNCCVPTVVSNGAAVISSLVAHGCNVGGTVENSIVLNGVVIEKDAVVKNSILFPGVHISSGARLDFAVVDKNTDIGGEYMLAGCKILPYFISTDKIV